jgi:tRNA A-37 threonylcarbamoyl transferase component Bud32/tetratricopeptide (TPR) repeat protein
MRLLREAQAAAALDHPNICTVFEVGEAEGQTFIVMQYVDGETLAARLDRLSKSGFRTLPVRDAVSFGLQVAGALAEAHAHGIVHRDIKPQNIMVTADSRVKVLDFGIATADASRASEAMTYSVATAPGAVVGTVPYMSPEQLRGEFLDARSDIFSLGAVMHEMLTGVRPFSGQSAADTISAILMREPAAFVEPSAVPVELQRLVRQCLEKEKEKRPQSAAELAARLAAIRDRLDAPQADSTSAPPPLPAAAPETAFVGRGSELEVLASAWAKATKSGQRSLVLVTGEPGIGKTRLCAEFAAQCAAEGAAVLMGRSDEQALIPYQPFIEVLGGYVTTCPDATLLRHLESIGGGGELAMLLPELARRAPELPAVPAMNAEGQRFRLFESVSAFLSAVSAQQPVLIVLDDLHWADEPSLLLLRHLARSPGMSRVCVVANYREGEASSRKMLEEIVAGLRRQANVTRVALAGFTEPQVGELLESLAGDAPRRLVQAIAESSGGNPFFVGEILRHLDETGALAVFRDSAPGQKSEFGVPQGVRDLIRQRLSRLSEDCSRLLTTASVIGQEFDLLLLEAVSGLPEERLLDAVDEATRAQLIGEVPGRGDRCRFSHALIRQTLYEELGSARRARMHRKIGEALEERGGQAPPIADLAHHFGAAAVAGGYEKAVEYAIQAGDRAASSLAHEEAARFYEMALRPLDTAPEGAWTRAKRLEIHTRRGRAFKNAANWLAAKQEFESAIQYLPAQGTEQHCELLLGITEASFWLGRDISVVESLSSEALRIAERVPGRPDLVGNAMGSAVRCRIVRGDLESAITLGRRAVAAAGSERTLAHPFAMAALYLSGRNQEAVVLGRTAAGLARSSPETSFTMFSLPQYAISLAAVGDYRQAQEVFDEARAFGRRYGATGLLARSIAFEAGYHLSVFDYQQAERVQREARELALSAGMAPALISAGIDMVMTYARTHNPGPGESLLKETAEASTLHPWHRGLWAVRLAQARAELSLARGDFNAAVLEAAAAIEEARRIQRPKYETLALMTRAAACVQRGQTDDARADLEDAILRARDTADPALLLSALSAMLGIEGDDASLAEARELVDRIAGSLPTEAMRNRFFDAEPVQRVVRL